MKFQHYLNEERDIYKYLKGNEIFELALNGRFLYRGIKYEKNETFIIKKRRKDRNPLTTDKKSHDILDMLFQKKFGWKARSEGIFVTNDFAGAQGYGKAYIFIPIKPYSFIWNNNIEDLWFNIFSDDYDNISILTKEEHYKLNKLNASFNEKVEILEKVVKSYTNKDIKNAMRSGNEIMFNCDRYILFNEKYFKENHI